MVGTARLHVAVLHAGSASGRFLLLRHALARRCFASLARIVREAVEPECIVWTCSIDDLDGNPVSAETLLTVTFEDQAGRTRLKLRQGIFQSVGIRQDHANGWNEALARLGDHLAATGMK
jgi:Activator of Hsp90 ATPase homolog 1-like protein